MPLLKDALSSIFEKEEIEHLSSAFDVIGDIAIIKIPPELERRETVIGETILSNAKNVKTVLKQVSPVQGEFRTRKLVPIAGEAKFETIHKENNCRFKVDVRYVYFSPRLSTERQRIANLVEEGEEIFNMFAGVGTFSIIMAKEKYCIVHSVDSNPSAIEFAKSCLKLNKKLKGEVNPILSDAAEYARAHEHMFHRIIMPLPERSKEFLPDAIRSAREGRAFIHYYVHVSEEEFKDRKWIKSHMSELDFKDRRFRIERWDKVREVGPRFIQAVADIELS